MFNVPTALRTVLDGTLVPSQFFQSIKSFVQRVPPTGGAVKNAPGTFRRRSRAGQQIGRDRVVDVGEITAGFSIPKDRGLIPAQQLHTEFGEYSGVFRRWILPWPENIEVAQADGFEAIATVERHHVKFARQLGHRVR